MSPLIIPAGEVRADSRRLLRWNGAGAGVLRFGVRRHVAASLDATYRVEPKRGHVRALQSCSSERQFAQTSANNRAVYAGCRDFILMSVMANVLFSARAFTDQNSTASNSTGSPSRRAGCPPFCLAKADKVATVSGDEFSRTRTRTIWN